MANDQELTLKITAQNLTSGEFEKLKNDIANLQSGVVSGNKATVASATEVKDALLAAFDHPIYAVRDLASGIGTDVVGALGATASGALVAGAAVIGFLAEATIHAVEYGEKMQDIAYKISAMPADVAALGYAFDVAGGNIEQAGNLIFMMQRQMEMTPGKFQEGLEGIGLDINEIKDLEPVDMFLKIADSFRENSTQADRAKDSTLLFGRAGRDSIAQLMKPLQELNDEFQKTHDYTNQDAKDAEELGQAWRKMKEDISWATTETGVGVLHFFQALGKYSDPEGLADQYTMDANGNATGLKDLSIPKAPAGPKLFSTPTGPSIDPATLKILNDDNTEAIRKKIEAEKADAEALKVQKKAQDDATKAMLDTLAANEKLNEQAAAAVTKGMGGQNVLMQMAVNSGQVAYGVDADGTPHFADPLKAGSSLIQGNLSSSQIGSGDGGFLVNPVRAAVPQATSMFGEMFAKGIPDAITRSLEGGGNPFAAVGSVVGKTLGEETTKSLTKSLTGSSGIASTFDSILGSVGGGLIGAGIGVVGGAIGKLLGSIGAPSKEELASRKDRDSFMGQFQSADDSTGVQTLENQLTQVGYTAAQAQKAVASMLDAKSPAAFAASLVPINAALKQTQQITGDVSTITKAVTAEWSGHSIPDAMKQQINALAQMKGLTDDEKNSLLALTTDTRPNFEALLSTADKYGITLAGLGPKFEQGHLEDTAKGIFQDFTDLTQAGGDVNGVLQGMAGSISKLVNESIQFGTSIPDNMKPLIQNLMSTGQLTDDSGQAITDMSKINFESTPLDSSLKSLNDTIDHLADVLGRIPGLAAAAGSSMAGVQGAPGPDVTGASTGGFVTASGIVRYLSSGSFGPVFSPRGTDTVPAMLTPGEYVLTPSQMKGILGRSHSDLSPLTHEMKNMRADLRSMGRDLTRSLRDALITAR